MIKKIFFRRRVVSQTNMNSTTRLQTEDGDITGYDMLKNMAIHFWCKEPPDLHTKLTKIKNKSLFGE